MFAAGSAFYGMVGQAAATLIGLMFVVMQLGGGLSDDARRKVQQAGLRLYLTPTLVHFGAVLFISMVALAPGLSAIAGAVSLLACSVAGLAYLAVIGAGIVSSRRLFHNPSDVASRLTYVPVPAVGYLLIAASSVIALTGGSHADLTLGVATAILLAVGIRNAWDMALFVAVGGQGGAAPNTDRTDS
jgi:hypothetical protein